MGVETEQSKRQRADFVDQQAEVAGVPNGKMRRFLTGDSAPRTAEEKEKQTRDRAFMTQLDLLLLDPAYAAAYESAVNAIDDAQNALDAALLENERLIAALEDRAVKLPDGRAVFLRKDGRGETAEGEIISADILMTLDIPEDATTIEEYDHARDRRHKLGQYSEDIDAARKEVKDTANPAAKERLKEIEKEMGKKLREINETPSLQNDFTVVSESKVDSDPLNLGVVPKF